MERRPEIAEPQSETRELERSPLLTARGRGGLAATCCVIMFLYAVYFGAISFLLPALGKTFGLGPAVEGRLFPANFGGFVVGVLVCGIFSDRLGRKAALLLGIASFALGLLALGAAPSFNIALLASVFVGGGSGAMEAVASALVADLYPERRAIIINVMQVAFGAGAAIGPPLVYRLVAYHLDWRTLYFGFAAVNGLLFVALAAQFVPRSGQATEALDFAALRAVLKRPAFGILCLAQALYVGAETGFFTWLPSYFKTRLPGGAVWAGLVVTVFWVAMTVGRVATGGLLGRLSLARLNLLMAAGGALCSALALAWRSPLWVMLWTALTGLCFAGLFGVILTEAGERFPTLAGTVFGGVVAAGGVGGAILPWTIGLLASTAVDWRGALALVPVSMILLAQIALWLARHPEG